MPARPIAPLALLLAVASGGATSGCGDQGPGWPGGGAQAAPGAPATAPASGAPTAEAAPTPAPTAVPLAPRNPPVSYPESTEGLGDLGRDLLAAAHASDESALARLLESLRLRTPEAWFTTVFGKVLGRQLADEYGPVRDEIGQLASVLDRLAGGGQTRLTIERFDQAELTSSAGYQSAALAKMDARTPLYSIRFATADGRQVFHLWSFVYQDGSFRYVGKMKRIIEAPSGSGRDPLELRLGVAEKLRGDAP